LNKTDVDVKERKEEMEKDPVCDMEVDPTTAVYQSQYYGQKYYFCSSGCKDSFDRDPQRYARPPEAEGSN
jgi:Cu+-exporting ATPase